MTDIVTKPQLLPFEPVERPVLSEADRNRPIWELLEEQAQLIPAEELDRIPHDGSVNHDHYLYGAPKKDVPCG
jgi:hypothetical protein